jgi:hypothetical protein
MGVFIMRNFISNLFRFSTISIAVVGFFAPLSSAHASNLLVNGDFNGSSGWTVSQNGGSGVLFNGSLQFSYEAGEVFQSIPVTPGEIISVSFVVDNNVTNSVGQGVISDTWTATLSSNSPSPASATVTRSVAHDLENFSLSITVPQGATTATITFSGMDNGYWAGHYGPSIDNVNLSITPAPLPFTPGNNGCGPYQAFTVTGTSGGAIWGSNPYTDDSTFSSAAVHAGLIDVGETAIIEPYLVDNYQFYAGSTANGISTYTWGSSWCGYYIRILGTSGETPTTTTTTTTTLPPYFNAVQNLTAIANENGSVNLDWDAPTASNVDIYAYGVTFYGLDEIGGTTLNGWGVWTNQGTNYSLADYMFSSTTGFGPVRFGIKAGNQSCFDPEGIGPCAYGPEATVDVTVIDPTPTTTTTTTTTTEPETTTTTTEPEPETTTTTEPEPETTTTTEPEITTTTEPETIPPVVIPPDTDPPIVDPEPETTEPETTIPEPETTVPEPETTLPEEISDQVDEILSGDLTEEEFANAVDEILTSAENEEELVAAATELLSGDLSVEQFTEVLDQVFTEELSDEAFAEVLDAVFEEPLSDEEFTAVIDAVLDQPLSDEQFENLVDVLSSDTVTDEQVQEAVDAIIENGITEEQATEIATSAEVLSSIDGEQAAEIFAEIPIDDITDEQALEIIAAVQDAPTEVRSSFEEEINIFGSGSLNTYVPLGSAINVGQRRAVIAAGAVIAIAPVAGASRRK